MRFLAPRYVFAAALLTGGCGADGKHTITRAGSSPAPEQEDAGATGNPGADPDSLEAGTDADMDAETAGNPATLDAGVGAASDAHVPIVNEPSAAQRLVGHYAMRQRSAATASALGMKFKSLATGYMLVDVAEREGKLVWSQRGCKSEILNEPASTTVSVADSVPRTTPPLEAGVVVSKNGDVFEWERGQASIALGFYDRDPSEPLPTDKKDPRVYDQESDGKPGITVHIRTEVLRRKVEGDTYNAQRLHSRLRGSYDGNRLLGQAFETTETQVLEATDPTLAVKLTPKRDDAGDNSVLLVKVPQGLSCDQLVQTIDQLF